MIRVLVADDHAVVRAGIVALLGDEPDIEVVGEAVDGVEAVELAAALTPDLVVMDVRMPRLTGDEATARILAETPGVRVLVLTTYESDASILAAIEAGASGYLLKAAPAEELLAGVRSVAAGEVALSPAIAAQLVARVRQPAPPALTPRETEVLRLVASGLTNKQIGERLHLGEATVKTHLLRTFDKLGVSDRTRAVTLAMERGLL
ncbi:LuxR family two component transcriptional regulator [Microcella putealis]|uniref:LuxR family two component transcriptional regulator n=1 Tax=Microcella putealis TaxID=337005 RepID=A0A4Q7LN57_9MICO|nr:response regulator transcription factor [Microcella putealis]RZS55128.1 LuxR family two component transcriptional regulator [Microcella putealis]TQM23610.1 LuxR family two component transcriptional regulator [Microcella putealis]